MPLGVRRASSIQAQQESDTGERAAVVSESTRTNSTDSASRWPELIWLVSTRESLGWDLLSSLASRQRQTTRSDRHPPPAIFAQTTLNWAPDSICGLRLRPQERCGVQQATMASHRAARESRALAASCLFAASFRLELGRAAASSDSRMTVRNCGCSVAGRCPCRRSAFHPAPVSSDSVTGLTDFPRPRSGAVAPT